MAQPKLSLCMIIRDEEAMLPDFFDSVTGLWDELIVVDTGSVDQSVNLAESAGARIVPFDWIDDFSAARNASLDAATGQWILFLDADERPSRDLVQEIQAVLDDPQVGAATMIMRNEWPDGGRQDAPLLRLFRQHPSVRFQYRIHEDISTGVRDFLQDKRLRMHHLKGVVHHLGYVREVASSRDKKTRDLDLLHRSLKNDPNDFYCWFKILEIARFWADQTLWETTAKEVSQLLGLASLQSKADLKQRPFSGEFAALVAQGLPTGDAARLQWLNQSADFAASTSAWHLRRGVLLENLAHPLQAAEAFDECLGFEDDPTGSTCAIRARLGLCRLAMVKGSAGEATEHLKKACQMGPRDAEALLAAVTLLPLVDSSGQPQDFIAKHLQQHPEAVFDLGRALIATGQVTAAWEILSPLAHQVPEAALGSLVCCLVLNRDMDLQVDVQQEMADHLFKGWIQQLWSSRDTGLMEAFADHCGSVLEIFPWLPDFLQKETRRLQP